MADARAGRSAAEGVFLPASQRYSVSSVIGLPAPVMAATTARRDRPAASRCFRICS